MVAPLPCQIGLSIIHNEITCYGEEISQSRKSLPLFTQTLGMTSGRGFLLFSHFFSFFSSVFPVSFPTFSNLYPSCTKPFSTHTYLIPRGVGWTPCYLKNHSPNAILYGIRDIFEHPRNVNIS